MSTKQIHSLERLRFEMGKLSIANFCEVLSVPSVSYYRAINGNKTARLNLALSIRDYFRCSFAQSEIVVLGKADRNIIDSLLQRKLTHF